MSKEITECERCGKVKDWNGSDIRCPFQDSEHFGENWNCGLMRRYQELLYSLFYEDSLPGYVLSLDSEQDYHTAHIDIVATPVEGNVLRVDWYKRRGALEKMVIVKDGEDITPTYDQLMTIADELGMPKLEKDNGT